MRRVLLTGFIAALALVGPALAKAPTGSGSSMVTIAASPGSGVFGFSSTISGQATGKKAGGASVELQSRTATGAFAKVATATADATGHYSFKVTPTQNTTYRVLAHTAPAATSANVAVKVRVKVTLGVSTTKPKAGALVRFSGFVLPAYDGKVVQLQRKTRTGFKTVARAILAAATPLGSIARSKYSKRLKISKSGTYRVLFNPADGLREANTSPTKTIRVH
jgi:hypothetical protein